jgi:hypothetical protein
MFHVPCCIISLPYLLPALRGYKSEQLKAVTVVLLLGCMSKRCSALRAVASPGAKQPTRLHTAITTAQHAHRSIQALINPCLAVGNFHQHCSWSMLIRCRVCTRPCGVRPSRPEFSDIVVMSLRLYAIEKPAITHFYMSALGYPIFLHGLPELPRFGMVATTS